MSTPAKPARSFALPGIALIVSYLLGIGVITIAAVAASSDGSSSSGGSTVIDVTLTEFAIKGNLTAPAGDVKLRVTNKGSVDHDVTVGDGKIATKLLGAGKSQTIDLGKVEPGKIELHCSVPGHKDSGMEAFLTITEAASGSGGSDSTTGGESAEMDHGGDSPNYTQMDADMLTSFAKFPAKTEGVGNQILQPTSIDPDGTKNFELVEKIAKWEVEPGKVVDAWTFNGIVPSPMFKLAVGDHIRVKVTNELPVASDVHWHGIDVPFDMDGVAPITQDPIKPNGGTFTYEFTVDKPYMGMYHPHMHGQMSVPNGMFGVFQVGPTPIKKGITVAGRSVPANVVPAVEMPMVLNDSGVIGYSLNGKSFPATAPIKVKQGDWVALTYYNEGQQIHPMHLHEFPQLVTARDGIPLDSPYWVDTLTIAPGERYTVMFHADVKGTWVFHCHILNHAERETGMFGMVTAVIVE